MDYNSLLACFKNFITRNRKNIMDYNSLLACFKSSILLTDKINTFLSNNQQKQSVTQSKIDKLRIILYRRMAQISLSIYKLLPVSEEEYFSLTSIASLTRVLIESYKPFYYLTIENIPDEEREFRYSFFEASLLIERHNMLQGIANTSEDPRLKPELINKKQEIINLPYYKNLTGTTKIPTIYQSVFQSLRDTEMAGPKKTPGFGIDLMRKLARNGCYKNDNDIFLERLEYELSKTFSDEEEKHLKSRFDKFFTKLMSNFVHSSAFAISMECDSNFQLDQEVKNYLSQMISCCIFYLNIATYDLINLYQIPLDDALNQELKKAMEGSSVFLSILTGKATSDAGNP
ncbi:MULTISPECIES: hypothetical protein [Cyanophyceae]|uniref:hypothetical protein n=1 Tax=Cyanophyceae TaxID=3028117 RepID=UPI001686457F|nr:hypothetical protein [Trichocoleus sp. FACHB-40]MBD2006497.1 hypothetical protein [Trichocoleus sp. FACHB-40]